MRTLSRLFLATSTLLMASQTFATAPFSHQDIMTMERYLFANFATKENVLKKTDDGRVITSQPGAILASPSNKGYGFSQDYQFHWTRDAAITMRQIFHHHPFNVDNYIAFERNAQQQLSNPGEQTLGQPKFNIDGTVWEGVWARPQNDGPALRALVLCEMAREHKTSLNEVKPLITTDLDYVIKEWKQPSYDLWEEVNDSDHFFTKMMQQHALTCAGNLLYFVDHATSQRYTDATKEISQSLDVHWNEKLGYITESTHQLNFKGGGLNSAVVLAVLYGNSLGDAASFPTWSVRDDRVMSTVAVLRDVFASEYPINHANPQDPPLIGRYPNDKYDGNTFVQGNPWVLTSSALAEYYYALAYVYKKLYVPIEITQRNHHFFEQLHITAPVGTVYKTGTEQFDAVINRLVEEGDRVLERIKNHQTCLIDHSCLHYAEQIDAVTGNATSAKDLTWGYVSIIRAVHAREKVV